MFFRKIISCFLLAVLATCIAPKELIHEFLHAHESADIVCTNGCGNHLSAEHQHCELLQLTSPPLYHAVNNFDFHFSAFHFSSAVPKPAAYSYSSSPFIFFRGPPAIS